MPAGQARGVKNLWLSAPKFAQVFLNKPSS